MNAKSLARALVLAALFLVVPAHADFHFMKIVEIFPGTAVAPDAQYIVLQMHVSGQQFVSSHAVVIFDADGTQVASFQFPQNVANGANQARILVATEEAQDFFAVDADLAMPAALLAGGGKVCFAGSVDCVAWGSWSGSAAGVGTPFNADGGLLPGQAAIRRLDIAGSSNVLDGGDDTNNCANDFRFGPPQPRNNAGQAGSVPGSSCGNDAVEGLEQCDDGNQASGDGCSSTCAVEALGMAVAGDDYDNDGASDVFWRHTGNGQNTIWLSARSGTRQVVARVQSALWELQGVGDFNGDGEHDVFWRHTGNGRNTIWLSGRSGTRQPTIRVASQDWRIAGVDDFDGDGRDDIFWRNLATGRNTIWRSGRSSTRLPAAVLADTDWVVGGTGDFDGSGEDDVLWRHVVDGRNMIWLSGDASTPMALPGVTDQQWHQAGTGDFDGDGEADIFWRHLQDGRNTIWLSADASTQQPTTAVTDLDWRVADIGDFDGDGRDDVLWRHMSDGRNTVWRSATVSTQQSVTRVANQAWVVVPDEGQVPPDAPEPPAGPILSIADRSVSEGSGGMAEMTFTVQLSSPATAPVTYAITTSDGTAVAGDDYLARTLEGERIETGQSSRTFEVMVLGDTAEEGNETLYVTVSQVSGGGVVVEAPRARGTIIDDDYTY